MRALVSQLVFSGDFRQTVSLFMSRVWQIQKSGCIPVIVFDGFPNPLKAKEDNARKAKREKAIAQIQQITCDTPRDAQRKLYTAAVGVTLDLKLAVIKSLIRYDFKFIFAYREADAELKYLSSTLSKLLCAHK